MNQKSNGVCLDATCRGHGGATHQLTPLIGMVQCRRFPEKNPSNANLEHAEQLRSRKTMPSSFALDNLMGREFGRFNYGFRRQLPML